MNGVERRSDHLLRTYAQVRAGVRLVDSEVNTGSAGGFAIGISTALELRADLIWLLDDDNFAQPDALAVLIDNFERLSAHETGLPPTLCSVRKVMDEDRWILAGMPANLVFPPRGSSMNFDVRQYFTRRRWLKRSEGGSCAALTEIPFAPYGGLLLHRATIEIIGLPQQSLFLYQDDTEYTTRIELAGGKIYLVRDSRIEDRDPKWTSQGTGRGPAVLITSGNELRTYYYVRNRTWRDLKAATTSWEKTMFCVNSIIYLTYAAVAAIRARRVRGLRTIVLAMWRGHRRDFTSGPPH
jgi:hypothetical protein